MRLLRPAARLSLALLSLAPILALTGCGNGTTEEAVDAGPEPAETDPDGGAQSCTPNPCVEPHRTSCVAPLGVVECRCEAGYEERAGACVPATTCAADTCRGHGTCSVGASGPACACSLGFAGAFCDACDDALGYYDDGHGGCTKDACTPNPCTGLDRTLCTVVAKKAVCSCDAGKHDEAGVCVVDASCTATSCAGHGACSASGGVTSCACEAGFGGAHCERCDDLSGYHADGAGGCTKDACLPDPCTQAKRSVCSSASGAVTCSCDVGYHLELDACVVDEVCTATTCSGHGSCAVSAGRAKCSCAAGWAGAACAACDAGYHADGAGGCTTDPCLPNGCTGPNKTTCVAMGSSPVCVCDPGAHADGTGGCTTDPCLPNPCAATNQACRVVSGAAQCYTPVCDDGNPCTDDAVVGGACQHAARANGTSCSTGICKTGETCTAGACGGGSARVCDDGNPCTRDTCVAPGGCVATNDDTLVPADDAIPCTVARCSAGVAQQVPTSALCDDGKWCTGEDVCQPGAGADARGCVVRNVPVAPGPSTPCRSYACSEATHAFTLASKAAGASCDDGIGCTTGDVCDAAGLCAGAASAACDASTGACASTTALPSTIDVAIAPVTGHVTQNGAPLAMTSDAYENGVVWARARDTGKLHRLLLVDWTRNGSYPNYTRSVGADQIRTTLVPGVYDVLWQRAWQSSGDYVSERAIAPSLDPVVNGYRVLASQVVVPVGGRTLDVDIGATVVTGTVRLNGGAMPLVSDAYENGVVWARAKDTGKLHRLALLDWTRNGSYPSYTRSAASDKINTMLVPGTYDVLWQRAWQSSGDYVSERAIAPSLDPVVNGYRVLATNVVVAGASQVLDVDVGATVVTGVVTLNGGAMPLVSDAYENGVVWARARDTGKLHRLALLDWTRNGSYPSYTRSASSDQINTMLVPGAYDLLWQRAWQSSGDYVSERAQSPTADPVVNGYRVLAENVTISGAAQVLNVDVGATVVTGVVTLNGGAMPLVSDAYENGVVWARARDTGKLHRLALLDWTRNGSYPSYTRSASSDQIKTMLVPGAYDLLWQRAWQSSGDYVSERALSPTADPVVNGYRVLAENVTISGATQVLNVDVGATVVTGTVTLNGGLMPLVSDAYENGVVWARARDTGKLHRLALLDWTRNGSYPSYTRTTTSDKINTLLVPGAYDLLWQRAWQSSGDYVSERALSPTADPVVNGHRVLRENVAIGAGAQALDVDVTSVAVSGVITMNAATLPLVSDAYENGVLWLRARDTAKLHRLALIDWTRNGSYPSYTRTATSDHFASTLVPGAYDLLWQRAWQSSGDFVSEQTLTPTVDPVVNGYRVLQTCVLVK